MTRTIAPTRDRIIKAAGKLFNAQGVRAVSVDAVAEKAGLTKKTFYYHFRSKDDLIAACLETRDPPNLAQFQKWFTQTEGTTADKVQGIFRNLAILARHPDWKGCGFLRTSVELIHMPGHPAIIVGRAHKNRVEDWLYSVFVDERPDDEARRLARQILLLLDGAFAVVLLHRDPTYMDTAGEAAAQLVGD
ncbi:TetR/AcrR family transcriptional regulator [Aureimonas fodinaquatilis]|uniref:TetR/AcrR family transcriptional regulator n=1 Tax=Aureimonas fodinaquatilis TaxID=2565783 RepID=A0A5B0E3J1_9HYPH|nr:TetR/AcrR family transcriptional regulator [Aureimonas fodinaquatilis]KAA0971969.1 TetR/AcrR family transcriptional regulator [Aureimonas fodinaquatilis]